MVIELMVVVINDHHYHYHQNRICVGIENGDDIIGVNRDNGGVGDGVIQLIREAGAFPTIDNSLEISTLHLLTIFFSFSF